MKCKTGIVVMYIFLLSLFVFAVMRLYTVACGKPASQVLSGQYSRKMTVTERRGAILDRNGKLLNLTEDGNICLVIPDICEDPKNEAEKLAKISEYSQSEIYDRLLRGIPFTLKTTRKYTSEAANSYICYKEGTVCAPHIVGYTDASGKGVSGIEKYFDDALTNTYNGKVVYRYRADALGVPLEDSMGNLSDNGYGLIRGVTLTLDRDLQRYCEKLVKQYSCSGAVCVTDTNTGEILACVSFPDFVPERIADYLESGKGEFTNRCTSGFTPGSIFKTAVAAAALEYAPEFYDYEYVCNGSYITAEGDVIPCHRKDGHGLLTMKEAYAQSCNPYFINLAFMTGKDKIIDIAENMIGETNTDIDGIFTIHGDIPLYDPELSGESGYLANLAIGQGRILISPVSACTMFSTAVTGFCRKPSVVFNGHLKQAAENYKERTLSEYTTEKLLEMMSFCVNEGLGKEAAPKRVTAGGKTATAQTGILKNGSELLNCWFCGVFPVENPEYTVCVLVCDTVNGNKAKEIFGNVCDYWYESIT